MDTTPMGEGMNTIAIVDDRKDDRDLACRRVERGLRSVGGDGTWRVIGSAPLATLEEYPNWLREEEVDVLILDQRLNESGSRPVGYTGHDIVTRITPRLFDLPVYYLTSIKDVSEVEGDRSKVRAILQRDQFLNSDPGVWEKEFIREGTRYREHVARKMLRLSELSEAAALGHLSEDEAEEAAALRQELHLVFENGRANVESENATRARALQEFSDQLSHLDSTLTELRDLLQADDKPAE
jgi:hypothetical protein